MKNINLLEVAKKTLQIEVDALLKLEDILGDNFLEIIQILASTKGRLVFCGIGKSAHIANKIIATLNSTGTTSTFLHAAEAIHGDLGLVEPEDVCLVISKSGNTAEIKTIIPLLKNLGNTVIGITANNNSYLANNTDYQLITPVEKEACINNLAPMTSTTSQLVLGDIIANCLQAINKFGSKEFAKSHPGGALGKRLYYKVEDMIEENQKPEVAPEDSVRKVILSISKSRFGSTVVVENNQIKGIITDGDLRRMLEKYEEFNHLKAKDIMTINPKIILKDALAIQAMQLLESHNIGQLIVNNEQKEYLGILDIHDLIKEGIY